MNQSFSKIWIIVVLIVLTAGGIFAWQYFWVPKEEVKAPEEKVAKDETVDWQTYRNEEYGFEFQYPGGWLIERDITASSDSMNMFNVIDPYDGVKIRDDIMKVQFQYRVGEAVSGKQDYISNIIKESEGPPNLDFPRGTINREWVSSFVNGNGVEIIEFREGLPSDLHYDIPLNNNFSEVLHVLVWNPDVRFNQILSTFRFLE